MRKPDQQFAYVKSPGGLPIFVMFYDDRYDDGEIYATRCEIATPERCAGGYAFVSPNDEPDEETGQKYSLERALQDFPKETRRLIWTVFWEYRKSLLDIRYPIWECAPVEEAFSWLKPGQVIRNPLQLTR